MKKSELELLLSKCTPLGYKWNHKLDEQGPLRPGEVVRISGKNDAKKWASEYTPGIASIEPVYTLSELLRAADEAK